MKNTYFFAGRTRSPLCLAPLCMVTLCLAGMPVLAQDGSAAMDMDIADLGGDGITTFEIGAHLEMGMAGAAGDADNNFGGYKPRFAGGFVLDGIFFLSKGIGLHAGLGLVGKGYRLKYEDFGTELKIKDKRIYLEIPLGVMMKFDAIRVGADLALLFALSGKAKSEADGVEVEVDYNDDAWDGIRRFNLAPKIWAGYAIPLGPVLLIPGINFSFHLLNDLTNDNSVRDWKSRSWNLMFTVGGMFGI